ncbi:MAG: hypothetical protein Q8K60_01510 [Parachlamydiaceae bacterium]|nr:hypothetical protein [Parachlamydiaceae bacterium]
MNLLKKLLFIHIFSLWITCQAASINQTNFYPLLPQETVLKNLEQHIPFNPQGTNLVGYLYIGDHETMISESTWLYVKQGLEYYKKNKPIFIILELDTPGGEIFAAQKISDALKAMDIQENIPIVAYINNWAISAGAMLAYSSRFIVTTKDGSIGAAEPVYPDGMGKMESASEKINSAIRADFGNRASYFGRNSLLAEAMVDKDLILVLRKGKIIRLENENQIKLTGADADIVISSKGKLLTLTAEQMINYGVADLLLSPTKLTTITQEEEKLGKWPGDKMLLFHAPFFERIPHVIVDAYKMDWKTKLFVFLASPIVSSLLMMGLIIGGYLEFSQPGLSFPGFIAVTCLFLMILSHFSLELAGWLELIILLTGLTLIIVELFLVPTFGLLGVFGVILFIIGLFGMLLPNIDSVQIEPDTKTINAAGEYFLRRLAWLSGTFILSLILIGLLAKHVLPRFSGMNSLILSGNEQDASKGFTAGLDRSKMPLPGTIAIVYATLRPAGKIVIDQKIYDALSDFDFIPEGEKVIVTRVEEGGVFVERIKVEGE